MSEPIVLISRNKIKEGKTEEFRKHYQDSIQPIFDDKPNMLVQLGYENEEESRIGNSGEYQPKLLRRLYSIDPRDRRRKPWLYSLNHRK